MIRGQGVVKRPVHQPMLILTIHYPLSATHYLLLTVRNLFTTPYTLITTPLYFLSSRWSSHA